MAPEPELINLTLHVDLGPDADADELDRAARQLGAELVDAGAEAARPLAAGPAPAGAKTGEALVLGALSLTALAATLPALLLAAAHWAGRGSSPPRRLTISRGEGPQRTVLEIEAGLLNETQLQALLEQLLSAPAPPAGGVSVQSAEATVGGDLVGRDQIHQTIIQASPGATVVVNPPAPGNHP